MLRSGPNAGGALTGSGAGGGADEGAAGGEPDNPAVTGAEVTCWSCCGGLAAVWDGASLGVVARGGSAAVRAERVGVRPVTLVSWGSLVCGGVRAGGWSAARVTFPERLKFWSSLGPTASAGALVAGGVASCAGAAEGASQSPAVKAAIAKRRAPLISSPLLCESRDFPRRYGHMPASPTRFKHRLDEPARNPGDWRPPQSTTLRGLPSGRRPARARRRRRPGCRAWFRR